MKKYLALLTAMIAVMLSSCSNEDVTIKRVTVINVNPSTVMSKFTYQCNPGDLDGVSTDQELRVRLFIYDDKGSLFAEQVQTLRNYLTTAKFELELPDNQYYTAIVITDVTSSKTGNVSQYWGITDSSDISSLRINYLGYEGNYGDQEILGVTSQEIYSGESTIIDVEAAGALVCTLVKNIYAFDDVRYIWVWGNRGNGFYDFSTYGNLNTNPDLEVNPDFIDIDTANPGSNARYSYKFIMPQTNYSLTLFFADDSGNELGKAEETGLSLKQGHEYLYLVHLDPNDTGSRTFSKEFSDVTGKTYSSTRGIDDTSEIISEGTISNSCKQQKTWLIKDLIK